MTRLLKIILWVMVFMTMVTPSFAATDGFYVDVGKDDTVARLVADRGGDLFVVSSSPDGGTIQRVTPSGVLRWKVPVEFEVRDATISHGVMLVCTLNLRPTTSRSTMLCRT